MRAAAVVILGILATLGAAAPAHADAFDTQADAATKITRLDDLVWALAAPCDAGDDTQQRQCRVLRDKKAKQYAGKTLLVAGERSSFVVGAWDNARKSVSLHLTSCISCTGVELDGRVFHAIGSGAAPRFDNGKLVAGTLYNNAKRFADQAAATAFITAAATARVDLLVKVPNQKSWQSAGKEGVSLEVTGYRVTLPCDGSVVISNPGAANVPADPSACTK
jgi:hypothetical protein